MTDKKLSDVEAIKVKGRYLRGTLIESLADEHTGAIRADDTQIIKFHGSYQQDDRDLRAERRDQKLEPLYSFMLRVRMPGGVATPEQWLKLDELSRTVGNHTLKLTTRQAFQLHGVVKRNLKHTIQHLNKVSLDTIAACGDVNRNVMSSANPTQSKAWEQVYPYAVQISERLLPKTAAYREIWLDGEDISATLSEHERKGNTEHRIGGDDVEPVYGSTYLPRKFKTAVVVPPVNDVDVYSNDMGFIAILDERENLIGFNVTAGGGFGSTHGDARTYPRLADTFGFVTPDKVLDVAEAIVTTQRDYGNREDRKLSRLKYTLDKYGVEFFKAEVEKRAGVKFGAAKPVQFDHNGDRFGWVEGTGDRWHLTLHLDAGRVVDLPQAKWLSGLREIAKIHRGHFRLTANQNLVIADVPASQKQAIDALVLQHGLNQYAHINPLRRDALACVSFPTCSLAFAEAERYLPELAEKVEARLQKHGLLLQPLNLRVTGCPNGCARPWLSEVGLIGKAAGRYNLYLGGDAAGTRMNVMYRENIDETQILNELDQLFARYAKEKSATERFGDWVWRAGVVSKEAA